MNFDLFDNSANGTAIDCRSSSVIPSRSTSLSERRFSSIPRKAAWMYHSVATLSNTREKNLVHSSRLGGPLLASRAPPVEPDSRLLRLARSAGFSTCVVVSSAICSSMVSPSLNSSWNGEPLSGSETPSKSTSPESMPSWTFRFGSSIPNAAIASGVSPLVGGRIGSLICHNNFRRLLIILCA